MAGSRIGVWLIGAKGGVAATVSVGLSALKRELTDSVGLVTELPQFAPLALRPWSDFLLGGHDIRDESVYESAMRLSRVSRAIDAEIIEKCKAELEAVNRRHRPGTLLNVGKTIEGLAGSGARRRESPRAAIERIQSDLKSFTESNRLEHVVVVNLASTEPPADTKALPPRWRDLNKQLSRARPVALPASSLYAIAALELGCSYVNFTPSLGATPPAIGELAVERGTRHMGYDGKTGETLLKSTLAPMFARRHLQVLSWVGHNIFGNMDGQVLDDPENKKAKVTSKDRLLGQIFGYSPQTLVSIEYIASLGDWKTAWDHIHFRGFLGVPMTMQFTWQGCDSLLAAPLVLDLVRLVERAWRAGETGTLTFLASFFKSPLGVDEHDFARQFEMLEAWSQRVATSA